MKVVSKPEKDLVPFSEMEDGQIGIIKSSTSQDKIGRIIQCYFEDKYGHRKTFISLGRDSGQSWQARNKENMPSIKVKILPKGTILEI